jgi:hypothetical protein
VGTTGAAPSEAGEHRGQEEHVECDEKDVHSCHLRLGLPHHTCRRLKRNLYGSTLLISMVEVTSRSRTPQRLPRENEIGECQFPDQQAVE